MKESRLSADGRAKTNKQWLYTVWGFYVPGVVIFAYNLLYRGGQLQDVIFFSVIFLAMCIAYYFGRKKHLLVVGSTRLLVYDDKVTYHVFNQPDITVEYTNIRKITTRKHGIFLVNRHPSKKSLFIPDTFEDFIIINKMITEKVAKYDIQAATVY